MESFKCILLLASVAATLIVAANAAATKSENVGLTVVVDFDIASGDLTGPNHPKLFLQALKPSLDTLSKYARTENIPAYGFGGYLPRGSDNLSQLFNLNMRKDATCKGPQKVIDAYTTIIKKKLVGFSEVGHIAPVIARAAEQARAGYKKDRNYYHALLILTDGFDDIAEAQKAATKAADAPMSIIVVGIGSGVPHNWEDAKQLDAQQGNVHFVEAQKINWSNPKEVQENLMKKYPEQKAKWQGAAKTQRRA